MGMMENRLSESRERRIRVPVRGKGITSLEGHAQGFRHVLYEGGKPWEREPFDWNVCLSGLIAPAERKKGHGDRRGTKGYKTPSPER